MTTAPAATCAHCEQDGETVRASYIAHVNYSQGYEGGTAVPVCDSHLDIAANSGALVSSVLA